MTNLVGKITPEQIELLKKALPTMSDKQKRKTLDLLKQYQAQITQIAAKSSFLDFVLHVYPGYKIGPHHRRLAKIFEDIADGKKKRVIVNIAPRHGKSELISYLAPAWFLGKYPQKKVIMASHTADLAVNFGRRVRNLVGSEAYKDVFPQVELQADSKSASRWGTNFNGEYFAIGVGGALAGRGADLFIIDDPHSEQEAKQLRAEVFEPAWEWFQSGPVQRLMPGGAIIVVMCMTGDTDVLMADGGTKKLKNVRPGDRIATYDRGVINTTRVRNWQSSGVDNVFTVKTQSGRIIRANERHPFLVEHRGERKWARLKHLQVGMSLVVLKDVSVPPDHSGTPGYVPPVSPKSPIIGGTPTPHVNPWAHMVGGRESRASAGNPLAQKGCASNATESSTLCPKSSKLLNTPGLNGSNLVTGSPKRTLIGSLQAKAESVLSAVSRRLTKILGRTGTVSSVSTIAMKPIRSVASYVMTVISLLAMEKARRSSSKLRNTYDFTTDKIVEIIPDGREEVFDIEVAHTGNFIANGVVSHNTRWSKMDLTGKIIDHMTRNEDADQWEVVEFPAILNEKPLWPEFWPIEELLAKKASMDVRYWQAQYMQQPTAEEGALIKREWWQIWESESPPQCDFIIMSLDAAQETSNRSDYNALTTWGVFFNEHTNNHNIILLNAIKKRMEFPELKAMVLEEYKEWQPDAFIVEKKSNGAALYQEMRRMGVPVSEFTPGRGQDKISRVNAVSDLFSSGIVWAPDVRWAMEVIEECNDFPSGSHDDLVDSTSLALMRFRQGGFIKLPSDEPEEIKYFKSKRAVGYY